MNTDARNGVQLGCFGRDLLGHLDNLRSRLRTVSPERATASEYLTPVLSTEAPPGTGSLAKVPPQRESILMTLVWLVPKSFQASGDPTAI